MCIHIIYTYDDMCISIYRLSAFLSIWSMYILYIYELVHTRYRYILSILYIYIIRWSYGNLSMIPTMVNIFQAALGTLVDAGSANAWGTRSLRRGKHNQRQSVRGKWCLCVSYTCRNKCRITLLHVELHTYVYIYVYIYTLYICIHTHTRIINKIADAQFSRERVFLM